MGFLGKKQISLFILFSLSILSVNINSVMANSIYGNGSNSKIILVNNNRALLAFETPVKAKIGQKYPTNISGLNIEILEVFPQKNRVYGIVNKKILKRGDRIFVQGIIPLKPRRIAKKRPKKLSYSFFYAISFGNFNEKVGEVTAESSQNSPYTFGISLNYKFNDNFSYSGSSYFSKLNSVFSNNSDINSIDNKADIPWEFGLTSYVEYLGINFFLKPYIGLDFESFSTFNTDELQINPSFGLDVRTHSFFYGTVGVYSFTNLFNRRGIFKASISTNFTSSSTRPSLVTDETFNGQKFILFFASNIWKNWGASLMYKQHMMTGPTDLTISRVGIGVSYKFQ